MTVSKKYTSIDAYHADFPEAVKEKLDQLRTIIRAEMDSAEEVISYNMPGLCFKKTVVHYAAFKNHISLFPAPSGKEWDKKFAGYKTSGKGTIQFPHTDELPESLIREIVRFLLRRSD